MNYRISEDAPEPVSIEWLDVRGITEARHFTMSHNLLGILGTGALHSRRRRGEDAMVDLIAANNCYRRWDTQWFDYVNLSIQRINGYLYGISSGSWHAGKQDLWWAVLGFDREILTHDGVYFSTTNNGYSTASRERGIAGISALFADEVVTWQGGAPAPIKRTACPDNLTTDPQAEVLYPGSVDVAYLRTVYVPQPELADTVAGWLEVTGVSGIRIRFDPEAFA